jgi:hypothetical protein
MPTQNGGKPKVAPNYATAAQVAAAVGALTAEEERKLYVIAHRHARVRGLVDQGDDLLGEAYARVLNCDAERRWNTSEYGGSFFRFMAGVISSIASSWRKQLYVAHTAPELGRRYVSGTADDGEGTDLLDRFPAPGVDDWRAYDARAEVRAVYELFGEDPEALRMLDKLYDGAKRAEIMAELGLTATQYATTLRRIERTLERCGRSFSPEVDAWQADNSQPKKNLTT